RRELGLFSEDEQFAVNVSRRVIEVLSVVKGSHAKIDKTYHVLIDDLRVPVTVCQTISDDEKPIQIITLGGSDSYLRVVVMKDKMRGLVFAPSDDGVQNGSGILTAMKQVGASNGATYKVEKGQGKV